MCSKKHYFNIFLVRTATINEAPKKIYYVHVSRYNVLKQLIYHQDSSKILLNFMLNLMMNKI